jgi:hypothetical protein
MAKKVVEKKVVWYNDKGKDCCGELDALCSDFHSAVAEANYLAPGTNDTPLTPELRKAIVALSKYVERQPKPTRPRARKPKKLKLEVGKCYLNREGDKIEITGRSGDPEFPFGGTGPSGYEMYRADGTWHPNEDRSSEFDLVSEA